jgi:hypothetical protein
MQKKLDKIIFLMETISELKTKLRPEDTGHIHTTISTLEHMVEETREQILGETKSAGSN